jgi:hypothetical protein
MSEEPRQPTDEELREALEEQLRRLKVSDVLLQTVVTLVNLAGRRLGLGGADDEKDLDQARLAIDATRALVELLPQDQVAPVRDALSQLQVAYAREVRAPERTEDRGQRTEPQDEEAARRAARSRIWTPPGT